MQLEVTPRVWIVFDVFWLVYCTPSCTRAEDVLAHLLWLNLGSTCFAVVGYTCCELKVSADLGWRRPRPSRQIPYTAHHSTLAEYVGVLYAVGDSVGSLSVIALILLRFK